VFSHKVSSDRTISLGWGANLIGSPLHITAPTRVTLGL
jgi:hypothetical protein